MPRDDFLREHASYRRLLREIVETTPRLAYWDASEAFCDEQVCWAKRDGIMFYRDRHHLSLAGARFLGEHVRIVDVAPDTQSE